jgi:hypothetical protein
VPDPLGVSFMPGQGGQQQNAQKPTPLQTAIQTLSLKIPRVVGAGSGAPQALLQGAGGGGLGNPNAASVLEAIRRMLFGGGMPGAPQMPTAAPQLPQGRFGTMPMPRYAEPGGGAPEPSAPAPPSTVPTPRVEFPAPPRAEEEPYAPAPAAPRAGFAPPRERPGSVRQV